MSQETVIRINPSTITVESKNEAGIVSTKHTNLEALQNILQADQRFETPLLPGQWGVQQYIRKDNREYYAITVPPTIREVTYDFRNNDLDESRSFRIPTPASLWMFTVQYNPASQERIIRHVMAYAIKNPILTESDQLYKMPFSNIGSYVCWGSSSDMPKITSAKSMQSVPTQFFLRPFNNDLGDNRFQSFYDDREGREEVQLFRVQHLFELLDVKLKEAQEAGETFDFPLDKLSRYGMNYRDAVRSLIDR